MASIVVAGNTSGTITLDAPAVAGTTTLTLPTTSGTIVTGTTPSGTIVGTTDTQTLTNKTLTSPTITGATITVASTAAPTFGAYRSTSNQSFSANTWTKVQCQTEEWDTNSNYDNTTNYRFTPTVAGYYQCSASWSNDSSSTYNYLSIYKNGVSSRLAIFNGSNGVGATISATIYLNGSTDYIEMYMFSNTGNIQAGSGGTYFQAAMIRSA
jgi:hypothetical protein